MKVKAAFYNFGDYIFERIFEADTIEQLIDLLYETAINNITFTSFTYELEIIKEGKKDD